MDRKKINHIGIIGAGVLALSEKVRQETPDRGFDVANPYPPASMPIFERGLRQTVYKHQPPRSMTGSEKTYYLKHKTLQGYQP